MKSFILSAIKNMLDPLQFAYRVGKSVDDAKLFLLDRLYGRLDRPQSHALC